MSRWLKRKCRSCGSSLVRCEQVEGKAHINCFVCGHGDPAWRQSELDYLTDTEAAVVCGTEMGMAGKILPRVNTPGATLSHLGFEKLQRIRSRNEQ